MGTSNWGGTRLHTEVRRQDAGLVRVARDERVGVPAGASAQEMEPGLEASTHRRFQPRLERPGRRIDAINRETARPRASGDPVTGGGWRGWIPACAGMSGGGWMETHNRSSPRKRGPRLLQTQAGRTRHILVPAFAGTSGEKTNRFSLNESCFNAEASAELALLHAVPPGTDPRRELIIAFHHLHRPAIALGAEIEAQLARGGLVLRREPGAIVPPQARALLALAGLPGVGVDRARAPAVFDHESGRRPGVERGDEIAGMAAERRRHAALAERDVVALAEVIEAEHLHHDVMDRARASADERDTVMARVGVQEIGLERMGIEIAETKAEEVAVERHQPVDD